MYDYIDNHGYRSLMLNGTNKCPILLPETRRKVPQDHHRYRSKKRVKSIIPELTKSSQNEDFNADLKVSF